MKFLKKLFGIKEIESAYYHDDIMTITYDDGTQKRYMGSCTVWHHYPLMERCSTSTEFLLCDIWTYIKKFGNSYPYDHLKV